MIRALLAVLLVARAVGASSASPYATRFGPLDAEERAARMTELAEAALAAADRPRAARAYAVACWWGALARYDPELRHPACDRTRALLREHPLPDVEAGLLGIEGTLAAWMLDIPRAVDRLQRAAGQRVDLGTLEALPVLRAHFTLGAILGEAGRYDQAIAEITFARTHATKLGAAELVAWSDTWLCRLHHLLGDVERAIEHCASADRYLATDPDRFIEMNLRWMQGEIEYGRGRFDRALERYRASYELAGARGGELLRGAMRLNVGATLVEIGEIDEGRRWLAELAADVDRGALPATYGAQVAEQQGELAVRAGDLAGAARRFEAAAGSNMHWLSIRALGRLAWARTRLGDHAGARAAHEEAIRRIERDRIALDGSLQRTLFMGLHAAPYRELAASVARAPGAAERALEIAEAGRARGLLDAVAAATGESNRRPLTVREIRARLPTGSALIEYVAADARLLALVVTAGHVEVVELPAAGTAEQLGARIALLQNRLADGEDDALAAITRALYTDVLAPVLARVPGTTVVLISADGPLHELPFEAIALEHHLPPQAIVRIPSGSMLGGAAATPTEAGILVVAPPDTGGLGELRAARSEAEALGQELEDVAGLLDGEAHLAAIRARVTGRAVLHFAGHAVVDPALPLRSALVVAPSPAGAHDGWWRAAEIYRQPVPVPLVVLSACGTARGTPGGGEGVASLARAFMHGGARTTIATLWDVDDEASARFGELLYAELAAGRSVAFAAHAARAELRRTQPARVWAAFVVTGDPELRIPLRARPRPAPSTVGPWLVGALLVLVAVGCGWTWRRRATRAGGS